MVLATKSCVCKKFIFIFGSVRRPSCFFNFNQLRLLTLRLLLLYHFIQFEQHVTFLFFRQISKIAKIGRAHV